MIENKVDKGWLFTAQKDRHAALARLGHCVVVVSFTTLPMLPARQLRLSKAV
ncbi:hypothetical protein ACRQ1B_17330 [Rhizobium panacihumi]|jgi:hypothetical protein|uniref:hypothetical protein n=1 Tax=Rhizobium panacihumi TaxID=2008450 RepID=UPI003D7BC2B6